jgi:hypothetical protein
VAYPRGFVLRFNLFAVPLQIPLGLSPPRITADLASAAALVAAKTVFACARWCFVEIARGSAALNADGVSRPSIAFVASVSRASCGLT